MMSYQVVEGFVYGAEPRWICMNSNSKPPFVATSACLYLCNGISFDSKSSTQRLNIIRWMLLVNYNDDDKEDDFSEDDEIVSPNVDSPLAADMDENTVLGEIYDSGGVVLHDLSWRVEKLRLEEQNIQRFLKARPRFLPYNECRKWVQAFSRWQTEDDWNEWIAMGEKRNAYIPSRPDEYYGRLGKWVSWDHFLLGSKKKPSNNNSGISGNSNNSSSPLHPSTTTMDWDVDNEFR